MSDLVKAKIILLLSSDREDTIASSLKTELEKKYELSIEKISSDKFPANSTEKIIQDYHTQEFIFIDNKFLNLLTKNYYSEKIIIINFDEPQKKSEFGFYNRIQVKNILEPILLQVFESILQPEKFRGHSFYIEPKSTVISQKIQSSNELGWIMDVILYYTKIKLAFDFKNEAGLRISYSALITEALRLIAIDKQPYPTVGLQISPSSQGLSFSIQFTLTPINSAEFIKSINESDSIVHFCQDHLDFLQINYFEYLKEFEIKCFIGNNSKENEIKKSSFAFNKYSKQISANSLPTQYTNINYKSLLHLIAEIPEENRKKLYYFGAEAISQDNTTEKQDQEAAMAKLMNKKNMLVQQLSERVEQEQKIYSEKHKKINSILASAKIELEATKKEAAQNKAKIKILERQLNNSSDDLNIEKSDDTEKMLDEINAALRSANSSKTTAEERVKLAEKKIEIMEKKYALAIRDSRKIDKDLVEAKAFAAKISKELESLQSSLKTQSAQTPIHVNNEEYEKKLKALSTKVYEQQQKEAELQATIKKLSLKVEQTEIGRKSNKGQDDGKVKQLERQVEQAKTKERELLKKIEDLALALKKAKSAKAA